MAQLRPQLRLLEALDNGTEEDFREVVLHTNGGRIYTRLFGETVARNAAICVGGVGGGFDSPALQLYDKLAQELPSAGVSVLRLQYRNSRYLPSCIADIAAGATFLREKGVQRIAIVGHSLGGAAAIAAGVPESSVTTVVGLASQCIGTSDVTDLAPRPLLLVHGARDEVLPPSCSRDIFVRAGEPKKLIILEHAGHVLDEQAQTVHQLVRDWLLVHLAAMAR